MDILAGLAIVAALTLALAAVLGRQHRAVQKLADTRAAAQRAEAVLADLQAGRTPGNDADVDVTVKIREVAEPPGAAPGPDTWTEVAVQVRGGHAALIGLAPKSAPRPDLPTPARGGQGGAP